MHVQAVSIYADGSNSNEGVGCASVFPDLTCSSLFFEFLQSLQRNYMLFSSPFLAFRSCSQRGLHLEISLSRLRIGHNRFTHGNMKDREATPVCGRCQVHLSVFHVLVVCPTYIVPRSRFFLSLTSVAPRERLSLLLYESPTFSSSTLFAFLRASGLMSDL